MKYENEKIVHGVGMKDYLIANGGVLKKVKKDLVNPAKNIYIFDAISISGKMEGYRGGQKVEH